MSSEMTTGWQRASSEADLTIWLNDTIPFYFRLIPAGSFVMGERGEWASAEPPHRVRITQPFLLSTFPVTQAQWRAVVDRFPDSKLEFDPSHFKGDLRPVEQVSWDDATAWCESFFNSNLIRGLTRANGSHVAVQSFSLPTEAQWEYACRAGTETDYYTGDGNAALSEAGWFAGNAGGQTHPVGTLAPNDFGLYDMHGNVDEWCRDAWDEDAYKKRIDHLSDPETLAGDVGKENPGRVIRGGAWFYSAWYCRSAFRYWWRPVYRFGFQGFRVCLVPGPVAEPEQRGGTESSPTTGDVARRDDERSRKE